LLGFIELQWMLGFLGLVQLEFERMLGLVLLRRMASSCLLLWLGF
jgi:hypothetical protein